MTDPTETRSYTVCAAFVDSDRRATVVVEATSYAEACRRAIELVDHGEVVTSNVSYDPSPTFVYGVVLGEDGDPFAGAPNVPDEFTEDAHITRDYRRIVDAAKAVIAAGQARMPSPVQSKAHEALRAALKAFEAPAQSPSPEGGADRGRGTAGPVLPDTEAEFLAGPGRKKLALVIDDRMAKTFSRIWNDIEARDEDHLTLDRDAMVTVSETDPNYRFATCIAGVQLLDEHGVAVGGYLDGDLAIDENHRGRGLGRELILEFFLRFHGLPTWDSDKPGFSRIGEAAHRSAYRLAQDAEGFARRLRRITR